MPELHGVKTKAIGQQLRNNLNRENRYGSLQLFYDHGDPSSPDVCQPTTYIGRRFGADATLSGVDIVITRGKNVNLAIEIEESLIPPKRVIGDVFAIALVDRIKIKGKSYSIKNATIIIAIADGGKGKRSAKYIRLQHHLDRYFKAIPSKTVKKVRIISCPSHDLVRRIERLIRLEIGKRI